MSLLPLWASLRAPTPTAGISPNSRRRFKLLAQKKEGAVNRDGLGLCDLVAVKVLLPRQERPRRGRRL